MGLLSTWIAKLPGWAQEVQGAFGKSKIFTDAPEVVISATAALAKLEAGDLAGAIASFELAVQFAEKVHQDLAGSSSAPASQPAAAPAAPAQAA
jgi:hypothetical protein